MNKIDKTHVILFAFFISCFFIYYSDYITLENRALLHIIFLIGCLLVYPLLILTFFVKNKIIKIISFIILTPFSLITWFIFTLALVNVVDIWGGKVDMSFECINEIPYGVDKIRVYRYNEGATMDYGIIVRKENRIVPGLILTNQYLNEYHQDTVGIEIIDGNKLKLTNLRKNNELFKIVAL